MNTNEAEIAKMERIFNLSRKYFMTAPSKISTTFTKEEIAILRAAGYIRRPGRKISNEDAAIYGAALTALSR